MPGALVPPGAGDPAGAAGAGSGGSTAGCGGEVTGGVGDVGGGGPLPGPFPDTLPDPLPADGAVFCCAPGVGASEPVAEATGVSPVPDPGDTDGDEL